MEIVSIISLIISIISIIIAIFAVNLSRKTYRLQSIRPHSEELEKEISKWILNLQTFILNPANLPDSEETLNFLINVNRPLNYVEQHLKSGYKEIFSEYKNWEEKVKLYNDSLKKFIEELYRKAKEEIRVSAETERILPSVSPYAYYYRIIALSLKKILTGFPVEELEIQAIHREKNTFYELQWHGTGLVMQSDQNTYNRAKNFIENLQNSLTDYFLEARENSKEFYKNYGDLLEGYNNFAKEIRQGIINKIRIKGLIEGKCAACP